MRALALLVASFLLASTAAALGTDDLIGTWTGTGGQNRGETLVLRADGTATHDGVARVWKAWGKDRLRYTVDGETVRGRYTVTSTRLVITIDGIEYPFKRKGGPKPKPKPKPKKEPAQKKRAEETPSDEVTGEAAGTPPPLEGVDAGKAQRFEHPRGWFSFDMPRSWSIAEETEDGMLVNPGLGPNDTLDALILVSFGELEQVDRSAAPVALIERYASDFKRDCRAQGIKLGKPKAKAKAVLVGEVPGGVQEWPATIDGGKKVTVWLGAIVKREYYLTVGAVILDGELERFLPRTKRIFFTLEAKPPERNPKLERLLAGQTVGKYDVNDSGSFTTTYTFYAGGGVKSFTSMSGSPSDFTPVNVSDEQQGNYEVVGDVLYMYFGNGQTSGVVSLQGGQLAGVVFGETLYATQ